MHENRAGRPLPCGFFELIGPAPVVGENLPEEHGGVDEPRIVDEHQQHFAVQIRSLVIVPLPFGRADSVSDEHHFAISRNVRLGPLRPGDELIAVSEGVGRSPWLAPGERGLGSHPHQCDGLEVRAVGAGGFESERLEPGGDVRRGELAPARRRRATLEQIAREKPQVCIYCRGIDRDRLLRRSGRG